MTERQAVKANRGDLVVIHVRSRTYMLCGESSERDEFTVGTVTSVTRDGLVKAYRPAGDLATTDHMGRAYRGRDLPLVGFQHVWIMSAARVDAAGAMVTAACHVWPGHEQIMAYGSLDEVREALRPHLRRSEGWERLHDAALTWETSRRNAEQEHHQAQAEANRAHAQAGYHTRAGDDARRAADCAARGAYFAAEAAANASYRGVYAWVTAPMVPA